MATFYDYENRTALDPYTGAGAPNAVGQVFAKTDTTFQTPLTVVLMGSGLQATDMTTDQYSQLPGFQVDGHLQVVFKSGDFTKVLNTTTPLVGPQGPAVAEAVDNGDNTVTFMLEDGTPAATVTLPASDVPGPPGEKGDKGDTGLPGPDAIPADEAVATYATTPGTATATALSATTASVPKGTAAVIEPLLSSLDMRDTRPLVIAQASDSTGDSAGEWFETAWKELLASKWPERPAQVKRWIKATDVYGASTTWQTAAGADSSSTATLGADTFTTARAQLGGTSAETGGVWAVTGTTTLTVAGGDAYPSASGLAWATLPLATHTILDGTSTTVANMQGTGSVQQLIHVHAAAGTASNADRLDVMIGGTGSITPILRVTSGGTTTTIATFTSGMISLNTSTPTAVTVSITVSGLEVSATVNGETKTATLTEAQRTAIADTYAGFGMNNATPSRVTSFQRTGTVVVPGTPSPLGYLTAYNAGYAGGRASHQLERLDAMFPEKPDALFINHGHNYGTIDSTPSAFLTAIQAFVDAFHVKYPGVPVVCLSQNPQFTGGTQTEADVAGAAARQRALRGYALSKGWGYIPGYEAFMALGDMGKTRIQSDGLHPILIGAAAEPTGARLQADTAKAWVLAESRRP